MTALVCTCPACKTKLQIRQPIAAGSKFKCPKCVVVFSVAPPATLAGANETVAYQKPPVDAFVPVTLVPRTVVNRRPIHTQMPAPSVLPRTRPASRRVLLWGLAAAAVLLATG